MASKKPAAAAAKRPKRAPRAPAAPSAAAEEYLARNINGRLNKTISPKALTDLRYFSLQASTGRVMTFAALRKWMEEKHGLGLGRVGMRSLCERNSIRAWWSV